MDITRIHDYPQHPEPSAPIGEYEREEKPRVSRWTVGLWGVLVFLMVVVPPLAFPKEVGRLYFAVLKLMGMSR